MKKLLSYLLMLAMLLSVFAPTVFAATGTTTARGDVSYGELEQFTEDHTIVEAHTEIAVTGFEEVDGEQHAIAMVTANGVNDEGSSINITSIIDLQDEKILHRFEHSYGGYAYHGDTTSDGKMILGAGRAYIQYNPKTKELTHIGNHRTAESGGFGGFVIDEGKNMLYSTETEYGRVNATDLTTGECTTIATLSSDFLRGSQIAQKGDYLYTSGLDLTNDTAKIFKIGKTKEWSWTDLGYVYKVEELSPDSDKYKNFNYTFDIGKYIVTQGTLYSGGTRLFAYDTVNGTWQTLSSDIVIGTSLVTTMTAVDGVQKRMFKNVGGGKSKLYTVDADLNFEDTGISYGSHLRGTGPWIEINRPDTPGLSAITAHYQGAVSIINFENKATTRVNVVIPGPSVKHRISYLNPMDGILWIGGYKGGTVPLVNTKTGEVKYSTGSQPEGMIHDPATGLFYHGDYTDAKIYEKDTTKPDSSENVRGEYLSYSFGSLGNDQDRPFDLEVVGRELYIASMPNVNTPNPGALSVINLDTEEKTVWQGIVSGQSLITLTSKGKYLYFGTSVTVGSNQPVSEDPAQVVMFDTETKKIVKQVPLVIPGVTGDLAAVKGLQISPDGKTLYGFTNGIYFTMDAETLEITNSKIFGTYYVDAKIGDQHWHNTKIYVEKNTGYLIYGDGPGGTIVDPDTLETVTEAPGYGWFCGVDENSDAWFVKGTQVYKAPLNVEKKSYTLSKVEPIDQKTLKLTLNKEFTGNMVGDIVKYTDGKNATSVVMQSVSGNSVTVTLASELDMETKYTIKPVGTSSDFQFDFETDTINWSTKAGSITMEAAHGSTDALRIYDSENDIFESFTSDGQGKFTETRYVNKQYNSKRGQRLKFPAPMTDPFVASFYFKRGSDNVTGIYPILESYYAKDNERSKNPSIIDINNKGAVEINGVAENNGTDIGNIGSDEWHYFQLVYEPSASESEQYYLTIYLDGENKGRYPSSTNVAGGPIVALGVYSTEYVSDVAVAATGDSVATRKSSHSYIKGFNVTDDLNVVNELKVANVKAEANRVIFTMTQEVADVPAKEDITIKQGETEIEVLDVEPYRNNENKLVPKAFVVTLDGPKNNAGGTVGTYTIDIDKEFTYEVTLDGTEFTGTYTESFGHTFEDFNDKVVSYTSNVSNAVGTNPDTQIKWLEGKYQGDGDFALGFTGSTGTESTGSTYDKDAKYTIRWADTEATDDANIKDTKYVVSVDFMRGSERVHGAPLALKTQSKTDGNPNLRPIKLETDGDLIFGTTTIATGIGAGEWHNVTMHIQDVNGVSYLEIYVDGEHKYGPSNYVKDQGKDPAKYPEKFYGIRSLVQSAEPTDEALKNLNCSDPERMDIMLFDNFYIGQDFTYKTSDITLREKSDGSAIVLDSCGGVDRDNPLISALYSKDGELKDLRINRLRNSAFDGTSWTGAHKSTDEIVAIGDIIKVFAVNDFIHLRPISNVFTKEVSK